MDTNTSDLTGLDGSWEGDLEDGADQGVRLKDSVHESCAIGSVGDAMDVEIPDIELDDVSCLQNFHCVGGGTDKQTVSEVNGQIQVKMSGMDLLSVSISGVVSSGRHDHVIGAIVLLQAYRLAPGA